MGRDDTVKAASPGDRTGCLDHEALLSSVCNITATARGWALLPAVAAWYGITPREREVVRHALEGLAAKSIARRLELSQHTVNDHLGAVYRKLGVSGREELFACLRHRAPPAPDRRAPHHGGHPGRGDPLPRQVLTSPYPG
ncbi:LuxR C-terminal-related transcriptional regulator [Streptomyces mirabilis]